MRTRRAVAGGTAPLIGLRGAPLFTRVYRWERGNAQHEVGHLDRAGRNRARAHPASWPLRHRQRLPRHRHPRLRRRRTRHGRAGGVAHQPDTDRPATLRNREICPAALGGAAAASCSRRPRRHPHRRPPSAAAARADQDGRHRSARRIRGGRPFPARHDRVDRRKARARDRRRLRLQRDLDGARPARDRRPLTTIEYDPARAKAAAENVRKAGLSDIVTVVSGDAFAEIPKLAGAFDFVFLDAWNATTSAFST